ncbi:MAG: hypothetical protein K0Q59_949 [Paenibacillus sp.]|nr:hypothetical protein [Paenibacillus sp.]
MTIPINNRYLHLLERWIKGAVPYLYECPDRPELMCYGTGENTWGVQTNQKAFAAFAMLAVHPDYDAKRAGYSREAVLDIALKLLRYCLYTHKEGNYLCSDNTAWGHTWISVLGTERMMHAVEALTPHLTEADQAQLRRVMISESDWLHDHYEIVAGLYNKDGNNKPESNLWNGAFLYRTAEMYPDNPRAAAYKEKGTTFLLNAISIPEDAECAEVIDGHKVSDDYVGANFFSSYGLNHHGYLNVGYMAVCLSNMAMLHFAYRSKAARPPQSLYRHGIELWNVVKACTFPDGRLLRIGGDTRVRYTYCQDYVIPIWHMIADLTGDPDCAGFEDGWLAQMEADMDASGDGTFLSYRCKALRDASPLYFTRLESDRACAISMGLAWRDIAYGREADSHAEAVRQIAVSSETVSGGGVSEAWHDEYHGAYLQRGERRVASWVWESAEKPQGLCVPPAASDLAEWRENLAGRMHGLGQTSNQVLEKHTGSSFSGGFVTWGRTIVHTKTLMAEGQKDEQIARSKLVCAALPDDAHMIVLQQAVALRQRTFLKEVKGLNLMVPNDVFNDNHRTYYYESGKLLVNGYGSEEETVRTGSRWLNVDGKLGVIAVYGAEEMTVHRPGRRQIGMSDGAKTQGHERTLYADELCGPCTLQPHSVAGNETFLDTGYVLRSGEGHQGTALYAASGRLLAKLDSPTETLRGVRVQGADGHMYAVVANFGDADEVWHIPHEGEGIDLAGGDRIQSDRSGMLAIKLPADSAKVFRFA